jgi:hypothetical protein
MILADDAFSKTIGLIITFGGIGVVVNVILAYIFLAVRGEHRENVEHSRAARRSDQP